MKEILFVTDYVCPYCIVTKAALGEALKETGIQAKITMQPYELTVEPAPRIDTYHDEKRKSRYEVLKEPARQLGLDMKFPPAVCPRPYTRLAFEGYFFASEHGLGDVYSDQVYRAYFIDEKDIGELDVLAELAESIGLDSGKFKEALLSGTYTQKEKEAVAYSRDVLKIQGVPTIYIDGKQITLEEHTKEEMVRLLLQ